MRRRVWLLAVLVGLTACGPTIRYVYSKPGVTQQQRTRDESECERVSWVSDPAMGYGYGGLSPSRRFDRGRFNRCMEGRGYAVQKVTD